MSQKTPKKDQHGVDMSPEAIADRLQQMEELYQLGRSLQTARFVRNVNDNPEDDTKDKPEPNKDKDAHTGSS